jgi:hypothetical protein
MSDTKSAAPEFQAAIETLRVAAHDARRSASHADSLVRSLADPVADWLESWSPIDFHEDGPMVEDFKHALRIVRVINGTTPQEVASHG